MKKEKALTLKTLTKSNVWDIQENDVFRLWEAAEKDADLKDCQNKYVAIIRSAFEIEEVKISTTSPNNSRSESEKPASDIIFSI